MDNGKIRDCPTRGSSLVTGILLVLLGPIVFGQGCTDMEKFVQENQRQHELAKQQEWAEKELRKGNLLSSRTLFEYVRKESNRPAVQQRAQFYSAFTTLLDEKDKNRWDRSQQMFMHASEEFPEGDLGQISAHVAATLSDVLDILAAVAALKEKNATLRQEIDLAGSKNQKINQLVKKQKKQLSAKAEEIAVLKNSILLRDKEIKSLELKIKKLEEIHKEIKEKREGLS